MTMLGRLMNLIRPPIPTEVAYGVAMRESDDLLRRMRAAAEEPDAVRSLMASIWLQRRNVPFVTTLHEAVQEMQSPMVGTTARPPPPRGPGE